MRKLNFTLFELIIVLAIIAILASMLLPALNKARMKAKTISCLNVLKQTACSFANYSNDHNNWGPASYMLGSNTWISVMGLNQNLNTVGLGYIQWDYHAQKGMLICPERILPRGNDSNIDYAVPNTLGLTAPYLPPKKWSLSSDTTLMKIDSIKTPSHLGWLGDSNDYGGNGYWIVRHSNAVNIAFVDLHAATHRNLPKTPHDSQLAVNFSSNITHYPFSGNPQ